MTPGALAWIERFTRHLATERRLSPHTSRAYARDLAALVRFCERAGVADWPQLDAQHVRSFAAHAHAGGLGPRSIQRRLSALRSFFNFLQREALAEAASPGPHTVPRLAGNPASEVRAPKARRRLPGTLDPDQMARLLELPTQTPLAVRDRAIMELFYSSGLRLAELVGLNLDRIELADRTVRVEGKGGRQRVVPLGRVAEQALRAWLELRARIAPEREKALFVGRGGRRLGPRAIQARVAYWARQRGLPMHVHPHLFRHSFASHLLESSGELRGVQELLGHANISTTQIYTHLDFQHLARIYDATHPRARRRSR